MNQLQIDGLRDFAIDHLPRAKADREQVEHFGGTHADFYMKLAVTATMVRGKAGTTAIEFAAANVLETISLLCTEREEPLSRATQKALFARLANYAKELCTLTGNAIPWLEALPAELEPETEDEPPAPAPQAPLPPVAGRLLSTAEAAKVLGYEQQTLRKWASTQTGPIQPIKKVGRHLRWSGDEALALMTKK